MSIGLFALAAGALSLAALALNSLSVSGAVAATAVGWIVLIGTGWAGGAVLASFFLGSTLISGAIRDPSVDRFGAKGTRRDGAQVLANGGPAAIGAFLAGCTLHSAPCTLHPLGVGLLVASLAAAAADTWATSLGATSSRPPRLITTGRPVPPGTSGGLSWPGTLGALLGATTVGTVAALGFRSPGLLPLSLALGVGGMLLDSVLGAGIQARYYCPGCRVSGEAPVHRCGAPAVLTGGWRWCTNDLVNLLATAFAGSLGAALYHGNS